MSAQAPTGLKLYFGATQMLDSLARWLRTWPKGQGAREVERARAEYVMAVRRREAAERQILARLKCGERRIEGTIEDGSG